MADKEDVRELARKLDHWAQKTLPEEQRTLLRWLLSRGVYTEERVDKQRVEGTATYVFKMDIEQAVKDALGPLTKINLPDPKDGSARTSESWARASESWTRAGDNWARSWGNWARTGDGWARDGYWALGMGSPPKID